MIIMLVIVVDVAVTRFMIIGFIMIGVDIRGNINIIRTRFVIVSNNIVTKITIVVSPNNINVIVMLCLLTYLHYKLYDYEKKTSL